MKERYLSLLSAIIVLITAASCASEDSSSGSVSSVSETAASTTTTTAATTAAPVATTEKVTEPTVPAPPAMDSPYKILTCLDIEGEPATVCSCGNIAVLQCSSADSNGNAAVKCYVVDVVNDKLLRTIDIGSTDENLLGADLEGTVTAVFTIDDTQKLVYYKPDGSRVETDRSDSNTVLQYGTYGQLYDFGRNISRMNSDGSREVIFDPTNTDEINCYDDARNRAVAIYPVESFTVGSCLGILDTSADNNISMLDTPYDAVINSAGDYFVACYSADSQSGEQVYSVFEKATGKQTGNYSLKDGNVTYAFSKNSSYGICWKQPEGSEPFGLMFLRASDGATGTMPVDIPGAEWAVSTDITSADRLLSAVAYNDTVSGKTKIKLVMSDPAQVNYNGTLDKAAPYKRPEEKNYKCGDKLKEQRAKADDLEKKYGVRILIGDEVRDLEDTPSTFDLNSAESDNARADAIEMTGLAVNELGDVLAGYPEGFFDKFRINGKGGLCIALVDSLSIKDKSSGLNSASGITYTFGAWEIIAIESECICFYNAVTFHHELFHAVELAVSRSCGAINETEWRALDPENFRYTEDLDSYVNDGGSDEYTYGADDDPYFYRDYGKVTPMEDRATLIEGIFANVSYRSAGDSAYIKNVREKYPHLKAKYEYLGKWTSQLFGYVYWEKMLNIKL